VREFRRSYLPAVAVFEQRTPGQDDPNFI